MHEGVEDRFRAEISAVFQRPQPLATHGAQYVCVAANHFREQLFLRSEMAARQRQCDAGFWVMSRRDTVSKVRSPNNTSAASRILSRVLSASDFCIDLRVLAEAVAFAFSLVGSRILSCSLILFSRPRRSRHLPP